MPRRTRMLNARVLRIVLLAIVLGVAASVIAKVLVALIGLITNLAFYGRWSTTFVNPTTLHLGAWVIAVPIVGGLIVGVMARWGSTAIRGHGIPEAMEQILLNESRVPPRVTWLKPVSSAIAIGTGGPFGAEGPIIATGGALGSLLGQLLHVTADERKTLLAAGAAAGMAAIFSAPVSAVLLAVELLLFERRARSLIPVALATVTATGMRYMLMGTAPVFPMPDVALATLPALGMYTVFGILVGLVSIGVTHATYAVEDTFEKLPVHWMWWPAIGGVAVGVIGYLMPSTLGVGYDNITAIISGHLGLGALALLCVAKFTSWVVALGSGTSGGTLAPLFTIGGALGGVLGIAVASWWPVLGVDPRLAALVGMAAMFAGSSRALMTSVVFAFETTQQVHGFLPLLAGCAAAYLVSGLLMKRTIMTEKIERRGVRVPSEYSDDYLDRFTTGEVCTREVVTLRVDQRLADVLQWFVSGDTRAHHEGFPVVDAQDHLVGVLTRRDLLAPKHDPEQRLARLICRPPAVVNKNHSLREAADHMVDCDASLLVVVEAGDPRRIVGVISRIDLLKAHSRRLYEARVPRRHLFGTGRE
ncbi:chloride channel protein [Oleiagrimonas citrea]|uniref:Chloride channel protein n=2 Tax=Oleiagrimonas citrea TaxID=1665687 RepID=A0A846ZDZ5_9GAMM|nr:chloride channel protein [Oleiagrimonas citrea]